MFQSSIFAFVRVCVLSTLRCACLQYDNNIGSGPGDGYYWPNQRHQQMQGPPGSGMMPPHQMTGLSTLEYRAPPRRSYPGGAGPMNQAAVPAMMDESGLGRYT